jgi:hypothetical protein
MRPTRRLHNAAQFAETSSGFWGDRTAGLELKR